MLSSNTGIQNLILNIEYSKPNFIRMQDIFTRFVRVLLLGFNSQRTSFQNFLVEFPDHEICR